jgi:creatinine amidohydrolase
MTTNTPNRFPVMEQMTVKQVRDYLARRQSILVPVGITEQHGYHLPLSTDALIATHLAQRAAQRLDMLVAPTFTQSFSGGTLPGTINISPAVMSLAMGDMLSSLAAQGFRNFYLFICHGGSENLRALQDALHLLLRNNPAFREALIALLPVWRMCSPGTGYRAGFRAKDWHAGWLETSLVMHLQAELVRMDDLALDAEPLLSQLCEHPDNYQQAEKIVDDPFVVPRLTQRPEMQVGVMGDPKRATPELGRQVATDIVNNLTDRIARIDAAADGQYRKVEFTPPPMLLGED